MAVRIRLSRHGRKKVPFYWVVAAPSRAPRDGRFLEKLGTYNPLLPHDHPERVLLKHERIAFWKQQGAQSSERVEKLLQHYPASAATI